MRTDEQLMESYRSGSEQAFVELYERLQPVVRRVVQRHVFRSGDVDDVVQQAFLQLHVSRAQYRVGERLRPWLFTMAVNLCRDYGRRKQRRPESALDMDLLGSLAAPMPEGDELREQSAPLAAALESLSAVTQQIFREHFMEERALIDIARDLGANPSTVRVRLHRGCRELRATLQAGWSQSG